jgi:hypothetical protein
VEDTNDEMISALLSIVTMVSPEQQRTLALGIRE